MIQRLLKTWHRQIPAMACEPGCRECCTGDARAMTLAEWREISHPGKYSTGQVLAECPFLGTAGCEIYPRRPLICRLFGTVAPEDPALLELEGSFPIACPRGWGPAAPLSMAAALKIQVAYEDYASRELQRVIGDWQRFCRAGVSPADAGAMAGGTPALPEKFQWLRYVLSTREGQTTLRLLWGADSIKIDPKKMASIDAILGG